MGLSELNSGSSFGWLHLTDLHQGLHAQSWLWPGVREKLREDLERLHERSGPWDFVLFTGDLTQSGSEEEFRALDKTLDELWVFFHQLGSAPVLIAVPGNHDLVRPDGAKVREELQAWEEWPEVQERFWEKSTGRLRQMVDEAFIPFNEWQARWYARHPLPPFVILRPGVLPGDLSVTFTLDGLQLGIIGLNSTFLQLMDGDFKGRLDLDVRQLHGICDGDAMAWMRQNHFTFLLTHHPVDWLHPRSRSHFRAEIDEPGRFAIHFFGHMHSAGASAERLSGFGQQCRIQGASLFGLENFGKEQSRIHGYSAGRIDLTAPRSAQLRIWPRLLVKSNMGFRHILPDPNFKLEDEAFSHTIPVRAVMPQRKHSLAEAALNHSRDFAYRLQQARNKYKSLLRTGGSQEAVTQLEQEIMLLQGELRKGRSLEAGDLLSARYELLERIGAGGFASVWKALDDKEECLVAVKVLHADVSADATRRERFFSGIDAMVQLRHSNILRVIDPRGSDGPYLFAVLEYAPGGDLRRSIENNQLSFEQIFDIVMDIGNALENAHAHGVIHRDVKPANILLKNGMALLGDFDLVRVKNSVVVTRTGVMGTFLYAAPEVLESGKNADARSDVFSLGMTVLYCLHGKALPLKAFRESRRFIQQLDCDESTKKVLIQAVEWDRQDRYSSITQFCQALKQAMDATPIKTSKAPPVNASEATPFHLKPQRPSMSHLRYVFGATGLVSALAVIALVSLPLMPSHHVKLVVNGNPSNTKFRMSGKFIGNSPLELNLTSGQILTLEAEAPQYQTTMRQVIVGEAPNQVETIELIPVDVPIPPETQPVGLLETLSREKPETMQDSHQQHLLQWGSVLFTVTPWAEVRCDGRDLGQIPPQAAIRATVSNSPTEGVRAYERLTTVVWMTAGVHECRFSNIDLDTKTVRFEVQPDKATHVVIKF